MKKILFFIKALTFSQIPLGASEPIKNQEELAKLNTLALTYPCEVFPDYEEAVRLYKIAAEGGDARAQNDLGALYLNGFLGEHNFQEAYYWISQAADQGLSYAQYNLGYMYKHGLGVGISCLEALRLYKLAARQKYALAYRALGKMYKKGNSVKKNYGKAFRYFKSAAEQGEILALNDLGQLYEEGKGVAKDYREAVRLYKLAAKQGIAKAQYNLGIMYENGWGVKANYEKAFGLYSLAAVKGRIEVINRLGRMYENGWGTAVNYSEAMRCYKLAAEKGSGIAKNHLGRMYEKGLGVEINEKEAFQWYRKGANQGVALAQNNLGRMYEEGKGTPKDEAEAFNWFKKGAEQGLDYAQHNLGRMYRFGGGVEINMNDAITYLTLAANQGLWCAQYELGEIYEEEHNLEKALFYYSLSVREGISWGVEKLSSFSNKEAYFLALCSLAEKGEKDKREKLQEMLCIQEYHYVVDNKKIKETQEEIARLFHEISEDEIALMVKSDILGDPDLNLIDNVVKNPVLGTLLRDGHEILMSYKIVLGSLEAGSFISCVKKEILGSLSSLEIIYKEKKYLLLLEKEKIAYHFSQLLDLNRLYDLRGAILNPLEKINNSLSNHPKASLQETIAQLEELGEIGNESQLGSFTKSYICGFPWHSPLAVQQTYLEAILLHIKESLHLYGEIFTRMESYRQRVLDLLEKSEEYRNAHFVKKYCKTCQ